MWETNKHLPRVDSITVRTHALHCVIITNVMSFESIACVNGC